ncbi:MAG: FAD-dependent oxidoreductase [Armatimonadota bacterium]|nr:FAD-dependent oxidoreductase [Armatimonadota bacterium]MDW8156878.1 FAD-dependent oxidoreductase [Armatimonadota bacterium]
MRSLRTRSRWAWLVTLLLTAAGPASAQPPARSVSADLVVYGATPQGVTAAAAAAFRGLRVFLAEPTPFVGGAFAQSWLNTLDLSWDSSGALLYGGLTQEFVRRLGSYDGVDVRRAERVLRDLLHAAGVQLRLGWRADGVEVFRDRLASVSFATPEGPVVVSAQAFVDATDLAQLAAAAGVGFTTGREDTGLDRRSMAAGLVFRLRGVSWTEVSAAACPSRPCPEGNGRRPGLVWGFNSLVSRYVPSDPSRFTLRGLELALQGDGSVLVKGLQVFGVDATDPDGTTAAYRQAQAEAVRAVRFLRLAAPHLFGTAELVATAPALYIRESRHMVGRHRLRADDVLYGRDFPDTVAVGGYPLDGQAYYAGEPPYLPGVPAPYGVPLRALLPERLDNLLVVSQAASFDSVAAFSARVVPLQMALGEAAGIACAVARALGRPPSVFVENPAALQQLRGALRLAGVRLEAPRKVAVGDVLDPGYLDAVELLRRGLFNGSYWLRGGMHLRQLMSVREWLENLEHFFRARGPSSAVDTIHAVRLTSYSTLGYPLPASSAGALLRALGFPASQPSGGRSLTRGEAARLLWAAFRGSLEAGEIRTPSAGSSCWELWSFTVCPKGTPDGRSR